MPIPKLQQHGSLKTYRQQQVNQKPADSGKLFAVGEMRLLKRCLNLKKEAPAMPGPINTIVRIDERSAGERPMRLVSTRSVPFGANRALLCAL